MKNIESMEMKNKIINWAKKHRRLVLTINILFIIIFINAVTFNEILKSDVCLSEIKQVNLYMAGAGTVDKLYLKPIAKTVNINNPILKPIIFVRDFLYSKGLSYLPKDDAESSIFWYYIKFSPFKTYISKMDFANSEKYLDDVYNNIQNFYKYPLKNPKYKLARYDMFITTANLYVYDLIHLYKKYKSVDDLYKDEKQVEKINDLFTLFTNARVYLTNSEPETLKKYHEGDTRFKEIVLVNAITQVLVENELHKNPNKCPNKLTIFHWQSVSALLLSIEHQKLYNLSSCQKQVIKDRLREDTPLLDKVSKVCNVKVPIITIKEGE